MTHQEPEVRGDKKAARAPEQEKVDHYDADGCVYADRCEEEHCTGKTEAGCNAENPGSDPVRDPTGYNRCRDQRNRRHQHEKPRYICGKSPPLLEIERHEEACPKVENEDAQEPGIAERVITVFKKREADKRIRNMRFTAQECSSPENEKGCSRDDDR